MPFPEHLLSINDLTHADVINILKLAYSYSQNPEKYQSQELLKNQVVVLIFDEASTRTFNSSIAAITALGGQYVAYNNPKEQLSLAKKETIIDTARSFSSLPNYSGVIIRSKDEDFIHEFAKNSSIPVINAGNGKREHPVQGLLDLYTIIHGTSHMDHFLDINPNHDFPGIDIAIAGDLKHSRTVRSLMQLLNLIGNKKIKTTLISPENLRIDPEELAQYSNLTIHEELGFNDYILGNSQVIYMTRPQRERWKEDYDFSACKLKVEYMSKIKPETMILHPLPRNDELPDEYDKTKNAYYYQQEVSGYLVRIAVSMLMFKRSHKFIWGR